MSLRHLHSRTNSLSHLPHRPMVRENAWAGRPLQWVAMPMMKRACSKSNLASSVKRVNAAYFNLRSQLCKRSMRPWISTTMAFYADKSISWLCAQMNVWLSSLIPMLLRCPTLNACSPWMKSSWRLRKTRCLRLQT